MNTIEDYEVCLSIQRALLDRVTPHLRRVSFTRNEETISLYFFYDGRASETEEDLAGDAAAEVISDFSNYMIDCKVITKVYPEKINSIGRIVFNRYEK